MPEIFEIVEQKQGRFDPGDQGPQYLKVECQIPLEGGDEFFPAEGPHTDYAVGDRPDREFITAITLNDSGDAEERLPFTSPTLKLPLMMESIPCPCGSP